MKKLAILRIATGSLLFLFVIGGCAKEPGRPTVKGTVTFKGSPVSSKTLHLRTEGAPGEFISHRIPIGPDGAFSGEVPEPGTYKVLIEESIAVQEGVHKLDKNQAILPAKYSDPALTDLSWTIVKGENKKDFELTE